VSIRKKQVGATLSRENRKEFAFKSEDIGGHSPFRTPVNKSTLKKGKIDEEKMGGKFSRKHQ